MRSRLALVLTTLTVLSAGWTAPSATPLRVPSWSWPLSPRPPVVRPFAKPVQKWTAGHRGIDLDCAKAQEIRAPTSGTVSHSGWVVDRGVITITTDDGLRTSFEPVIDQLPRGTHVTAGTVVARRDPELRHEGCASCLHWGVRDGDEYINPLSLVGALHPSVLLPRSRGPGP
ncbi:M23 family metallopeptidase [Rothia sp. HC945]|uniref:M23 family metallopeptidase n=1 Tax=Rothia sp. HC945 TaxID=3171170 RepID=UPI00264EC726|nr:M23 family metallopeptidase [Kocuria sp.]